MVWFEPASLGSISGEGWNSGERMEHLSGTTYESRPGATPMVSTTPVSIDTPIDRRL